MSRHLIVVTEAMLRRLMKGWRPDQLAERVEAHFPIDRGLDGKAIGKWERRARVPGEDYAAALCQELDAPTLELLGIGRSLQAQSYWRLATPAERDAEVRRRKLLEDGLTLAGAAALLPVARLTKWANWYGHTKHVDPALLGELEQLSTQIAGRYAAGETTTALPAARAHAYGITRLLERTSMTPTQRDRLGSIGADAAAMQGVLALGTHLPGEASEAFEHAFDLARAAQDTRLEALITGVKMWLWSPGSLGARPTGDPQQAVTAMEHACALGQCAPAPAHVWLHAFHARHLTSVGDADGYDRALARAEGSLDAIDLRDPGWGFFSVHGELGGFERGRMHAFRADRGLVRGRPVDAIGSLQQAIDAAYMPVKRAMCLVDLTAVWARAGEPEAGCVAAHAVLDEATVTGFTENVRHVRDVRASFPPGWSQLSCVRALDERLRAVA